MFQTRALMGTGPNLISEISKESGSSLRQLPIQNRIDLSFMSVRRLALFSLCEQNGIVRQDAVWYLTALKGVADTVVCIVSAALSDETASRLGEMGVKVVRGTSGKSVFGLWKCGLETLGYEVVCAYDELILCNSHCYGPVFDLAESFARMQASGCDYWGMTCNRMDMLPEAAISAAVQPEERNCVDSSFMVIRSTMLRSSAMKNWWAEISPEESEDYTSRQHEVDFACYMKERGYSAATLMPGSRLENYTASIPVDMLCADRLLQEDRVPFVNKKIFTNGGEWLIPYSSGHMPADVLAYIKKSTNYPIEYIWEDLLSNQKLSSIKEALPLNYILPTYPERQRLFNQRGKVALICYAYYPELASYMCRYLVTVPADTSIYIISSREDALAAYKAELQKQEYADVEFILKPNRGRDISALLVTCRDIVPKYDIICYVHDKKSPHANAISMEDFSYHCMECNLASPGYVNEVINLFCKNEKLGMLMPPTIHYADFTVLGAESDGNESSMRAAYDMMKLTCPFDDVPVAPYGTCFWARAKALAPIYRRDWEFDDFPGEPMPSDGTLSHGIERVLSFAVQDAGYYSAWVSPDTYAAFYMNNLALMLRAYNKKLYTKYGRLSWTNMLKALSMSDNSSRQNEDLRDRLLWANTKLYKSKKRYYRIIDVLTLGLFHKVFRRKIQSYKKKLDIL